MNSPHTLLAIVVLALAALAGAAVALRAWLQRRDALERDAAAVTHLEALVMQRFDLHLSVDERGFPKLHGIARGVRYTVAREALPGAATGLRVRARRERDDGMTLTLGPREGTSATDGATVVETGDPEFDQRFAASSDRPELARAALGPEVRAALALFPSVTLSLEGAAMTLDLGWLSERDLDDPRVDGLREVVSALCAAAPASVAT